MREQDILKKLRRAHERQLRGAHPMNTGVIAAKTVLHAAAGEPMEWWEVPTYDLQNTAQQPTQVDGSSVDSDLRAFRAGFSQLGGSRLLAFTDSGQTFTSLDDTLQWGSSSISY